MTSKLDKNDAFSKALMNPDTPTQTDRKIRAKRLSVEFPVNVTVQGNPILGFAEAINLSWSGMLVATNFPLGEGDRCTLEFSLPEFHFPIQVQAKVVRIQKETTYNEATLIAFAFRELETNISRMISGFVLEHLDL